MIGIVVSLCMSLFESICVVIFFDTFFLRKREKHKYLESAAMAVVITICFFVISYFLNNAGSISQEILKATLFTLLYIAIGLVCYKRSLPFSLLVAPVMYFLLFISDYVGLAITDFVGGGANMVFTLENPFLKTALAISIKIGLFFVIMVIRIICRGLKLGRYRQEAVSAGPRWILFLLFPALSLASIISLINVAEPQHYSSPGVIFISIGWLVVTVAMFFLMQIFDEKDMARQEARVIDAYTDTEMESLQTASLVKGDYHDYQHHLIWIEQLLAEGKADQAYEYIRSSPYANIVTIPLIQTSNPVVDAVVNQKYWKAKSKSMCIVPVMNNITKLPIDDHDLVAILANLLDNAIDACEKLPQDRRIIQLKIILGEGKLVISVRNPVDMAPTIVDGTVLTSKDDKARHGHGLRSVRRSLDRYGAAYGLDCEDMYFQFSAVIPVNIPA